MNPQDYSADQRKDIEERVEKAKNLLKELQLQPGVVMQPVNIGLQGGNTQLNDVFGFQPIAFLQDMKYQNVLSPIQAV